MKLEAFRVEGFRCLYDTGWIPLIDLTFFTGQNDGGKSSTLAALVLFLEERRTLDIEDLSFVDPTSPNDERVATIIFAGKFRLDEDERACLLDACGVETDLLPIERHFDKNGDPAPYSIRIPSHPDPKFHKELNSYTVSALQEIVNDHDIPLNGVKRKSDIINKIRIWLNTQPKLDADVALPDELRRSLPSIQIFSSESALDPEQEIKRVLTTQFRQLLADDEIAGQIDDVTDQINERLNSGLAQLVPVVRRYCQDIEDVTIRPQFNFANGLSTTNMQLHRRNGPVLLERSGAGQRRRISLAIYEWQLEMLEDRDEDSQQLILGFDEPDTHLDYNSQRQIFDLIERFAAAPAVQVMVATHSLNMIERVPIQSIIHFSLNNERQTTCQMFSSPDAEDGASAHGLVDIFMYRISENMGLRNSIMLHERCFLAVEGATEMAALPVLFYQLYKLPMQSAGICLINGKNQVGARSLTSFLHSHHRNVLFLVDMDAKLNKGARRYFRSTTFEEDQIDESTQVHYVGANEFEDAFCSAVWVRMLNKHYTKPCGTLWTCMEIDACRSTGKFSNALQGELFKVFDYRPPKHELGYLLATCIETIDEIPDEIKVCFEKAYQLGNS